MGCASTPLLLLMFVFSAGPCARSRRFSGGLSPPDVLSATGHPARCCILLSHASSVLRRQKFLLPTTRSGLGNWCARSDRHRVISSDAADIGAGSRTV